MIRAVLDTNVLLSGFIVRAGLPGQLLTAWSHGRFELVASAPILEEFERALLAPYFQRHLTPPQAAAAVALLRREAIMTPITTEVRGIATHPEDDLVLATAVSGQADYLVTGDKKLQQLGSYAGVTILSPRGFADLLGTPPID